MLASSIATQMGRWRRLTRREAMTGTPMLGSGGMAATQRNRPDGGRAGVSDAPLSNITGSDTPLSERSAATIETSFASAG